MYVEVNMPPPKKICAKDWYQPAVDVAYGPELASFWREAAIEWRGQVSLYTRGCLGYIWYIRDEIRAPVMWGFQ